MKTGTELSAVGSERAPGTEGALVLPLQHGTLASSAGAARAP